MKDLIHSARNAVITAAILILLNVAAQPAAANYQSGYDLLTDCAFIGISCVSVQWEVFISVTYDVISPSQVQIAPERSPTRICMKNAANMASPSTHIISSVAKQWYIYSDTQGRIDTDSLGGNTSGFWPACTGSADWITVAENGGWHWPPYATRVESNTSYCVDDGTYSGCTRYRSVMTGYMT